MSAQPVGGANANSSVKRQIQLPLYKAWQISLKSIRMRFARSVITAMGILLGIAFYSSVRTSGLFPTHGTSAEALAAAHRQEWLAVMALLVCFVGIINSMLMSVTERFKEIGTMKCLGALDSFIVRLVIIEAALMGFIASVLGWFAGWAIIILVHLIGTGFSIFTVSLLRNSLREAVITTALGSIITLVAAVPPAMRAAQMPPAAALRTEV